MCAMGLPLHDTDDSALDFNRDLSTAQEVQRQICEVKSRAEGICRMLKELS